MLVSYNVLCVINGDYRDFMKKVLKNAKVIAFLTFMLLVYLVPFISVFVTSNFY